MSLSTTSQTSPLSPATTNPSKWSSTAICQKLLYVCYYYARCFGMVAFEIEGCNESVKTKNENNLRESSSSISRRSNEIHIQPNSATNEELSQRSRFVLQANVRKSMLWFHIVIRFIFCTCFLYAVYSWWITEHYIQNILVYTQVVTIIVCPTLMAILEIWHRKRIIRALNRLFQLLQAIAELHCGYGIFQWTHVAFVALKIVTFVYEIIISLQTLLKYKSWIKIAIGILQNILHIELWFNLHVATLLYVCVEAMYGSLNHYMKHSFNLRLQMIQTCGPIVTSTQVNELQRDLTKFIDLFKKVHSVGLELHYLWQIPLVCTLVSTCLGTMNVIYFMIWQYFEDNTIYVDFVPLILKLVFDIVLLSLTAHRAIKSSKLIGCMGLEKVVLLENEDWHMQMEHFLYHINLYDFKLNCLGLFDITNNITMTFISGLLTSISIFIPFFIKTYRIQKILEKQN